MDDTSSLINEAIEAYRAGNRNEAVRLLREVLQQDPRNEQAWLYMGAAIEDPEKRRQAFQRVLQINPDNEKAKAALERLDAAASSAGGPAGGASTSTGTGSTANETVESLKRAQQQAQQAASKVYSQGFALPIKIEGAPDRVNGPYIVQNARRRTFEGLNFYTTRNFEQYESSVQGATAWDTVFIVTVGALALAVAELLGKFISFLLILFIGRPIIVPFLQIITGPLVVLIATGAGFAAAVYAARMYLKAQLNMEPAIVPLSRAFAGVFLPAAVIQAAFNFLAAAFGLFFPTFAILVAMLLAFYQWYLLKDVYGRSYGIENDRGMFTAAIVVLVYLVVFGLVRWIFRV